jgi:hypothetical protein
MKTYETAAIAVATVLGIDALIHAYWATGRTWPARETRTLSRAVLNADVPFTPRNLVPLVLVLTVGAMVVLAKAGLLGTPLLQWLPHWIPTAGAYTVAAGLLLRGSAGIIWVLGIGASRDTLFYWLNLTAYTPACLVLCAGAVVVAAHR